MSRLDPASQALQAAGKRRPAGSGAAGRCVDLRAPSSPRFVGPAAARASYGHGQARPVSAAGGAKREAGRTETSIGRVADSRVFEAAPARAPGSLFAEPPNSAVRPSASSELGQVGDLWPAMLSRRRCSAISKNATCCRRPSPQSAIEEIYPAMETSSTSSSARTGGAFGQGLARRRRVQPRCGRSAIRPPPGRERGAEAHAILGGLAEQGGGAVHRDRGACCAASQAPTRRGLLAAGAGTGCARPYISCIAGRRTMASRRSRPRCRPPAGRVALLQQASSGGHRER